LLSYPQGLVSVKSGCILIANQYRNNLVLVNPTLSVSRVFTPLYSVTLQGPYAMCYDESCGRLDVGEITHSRGQVTMYDDWRENDGNNIHVFDYIFDIGSDLE